MIVDWYEADKDKPETDDDVMTLIYVKYPGIASWGDGYPEWVIDVDYIELP